jgi:hypothetical protein
MAIFLPCACTTYVQACVRVRVCLFPLMQWHIPEEGNLIFTYLFHTYLHNLVVSKLLHLRTNFALWIQNFTNLRSICSVLLLPRSISDRNLLCHEDISPICVRRQSPVRKPFWLLGLAYLFTYLPTPCS